MRWLDLLFPRECAFCPEALDEAEGPACGACDRGISWIGAGACPRCGAALRDVPACGECEGRRFAFAGAVAAGKYEGPLRELVHRFKFRRQVWLARPFAARLAARVREAAWTIDAVVPVPTRVAKVLWEGRLHGAAETLAERLAAELRLPLRRLLRQVRTTRPQASLSREERLENPKGAYRARKRLDGGRYLLVDDVMTTGSTASAAAASLLEAGAADVFVAVVGR